MKSGSPNFMIQPLSTSHSLKYDPDNANAIKATQSLICPSPARHNEPEAQPPVSDIPIPKINFSLMRDSDPKQEAREEALEKLRVSAFTEIPDPDRWRGIGALATPTVKKLKAADWLKRNQTTYEK